MRSWNIEAESIRCSGPQRLASISPVSKPITIRGLEVEQKADLPIYHDLDDLAGTWTEEEVAELENATEGFRQVDLDLWSGEILEDFLL